MPTCPECRAGYPGGFAVCPSDGATLIGELAFPDLGAVPSHRPPSETSDPLIGTTLADRFKVLARIGHGGMGIVYRATHAVIGREVAVKVLHERYIERREVAARLMNEARLASAIRNEHIVDIFDFGETADGRTFVVMELLEGESLAQLLAREGALAEARALSIVMQVADALGAAHAAGIIHRDVKPENVFVSRRGGAEFVKVLDFGISKAMRTGDADAVRLTQTGMVLGTPLYMSPEQARGEDGIDERVDVYALGVILYECLTGETPFRGSNYLGIISDVLSRAAMPPREVRPDRRISEAAERVAARAMSKDRETRHRSMAELGGDLRRALAGETASAPSLTIAAGSTVPPRVRARKRLVYLGMVGIAACATVVTVIVAGRAEPPPIVEAGIAPKVALVVAPPLAPGVAPVPPAPQVAPALAPTVAPALAPRVASVPPAPAPVEAAVPLRVTLRIRSTPDGAEIMNGARRLGVAPQAIELPRSQTPVHLTFRKAGYADDATDVIPAAVDGETIEVELRPLPSPTTATATRAHHSHHAKIRQPVREDLPVRHAYD